MEPRYGRVYKDATVLLRPKTGLKDMVAELEPGTPGAGRLKDGGVIPVSQTLPDVNLDEILASLDADTRDYLRAARRRRRGPARQRRASWRTRSAASSPPPRYGAQGHRPRSPSAARTSGA